MFLNGVKLLFDILYFLLLSFSKIVSIFCLLFMIPVDSEVDKEVNISWKDEEGFRNYIKNIAPSSKDTSGYSDELMHPLPFSASFSHKYYLYKRGTKRIQTQINKPKRKCEQIVINLFLKCRHAFKMASNFFTYFVFVIFTVRILQLEK